MKRKKIYIKYGESFLIDLIFVHGDYVASAGGAKEADIDCLCGTKKTTIVTSYDHAQGCKVDVHDDLAAVTKSNGLRGRTNIGSDS